MIQDWTIENAQQALQESPGEIRRLQLLVLIANEQLQSLKEQREQIESELLLEIRDAQNENGKPKYSNDTARSAALKTRLVERLDYQELKKETAKTEGERDHHQIYIEYQKNRISSAKQQVTGWVAETHLQIAERGIPFNLGDPVINAITGLVKLIKEAKNG